MSLNNKDEIREVSVYLPDLHNNKLSSYLVYKISYFQGEKELNVY